jgi:hypothetical protein
MRHFLCENYYLILELKNLVITSFIYLYIYTYKFSHTHLFSRCMLLSFQELTLNIDIEWHFAKSNKWSVQMEKYIVHDNFSFLVDISFHYTVSSFHFGQEEGQKFWVGVSFRGNSLLSSVLRSLRDPELEKPVYPSSVDKFLPLHRCMAQIQVTPAFIPSDLCTMLSYLMQRCGSS